MAEANRQRANEIIGRVARAIKDCPEPTSGEFVIGAILSRDIGALEDENSSLRDEITSLREECRRLLEEANEAEAQVRDVRQRNAALTKDRDKRLEAAHEIEQEAGELRQRNAALAEEVGTLKLNNEFLRAENARVCREAERILSGKKELAQECARLDLDRRNWRALAHQFADVLARGEQHFGCKEYERRLEAALPLARAVVDQEPTTEPPRGADFDSSHFAMQLARIRDRAEDNIKMADRSVCDARKGGGANAGSD